MTYNILVVDDEAPAREKIGRFLAQIDQGFQVSFATNAKQAIAHLQEDHFDLMFLDIQMPQMNAFEMLKHLEHKNLPAIIFSTAFDRYALQAFDVHAVDYLLKPYDFERFTKAVTRVIKTKNKEEESNHRILNMLKDWKSSKKILDVIWVNKSGKIIPVHLDQVEYLESDGNYVTLHTAQERFLLRQSLKDLQEQLDEIQFIRTHKSFIVNKNMIEELVPKSHGDLTAVLKSKRSIPVSRSYRSNLLGK